MPAAHSVNAFESRPPSRIHVTAFGRAWMLEDAKAYDWIGVIAADPEGLHGIFPGLAHDDDLEALWEQSSSPEFGKRCTLAARAALGRAAGKDWWWALNLAKTVLSGWPVFNGVMLRQNIHAQQLGLADYLDAVYSLLWERSSEEDRMKLDVELNTLPAGVRVRQSPESRKQMLARFAAD